jgi:hypothetical protein
MNLGIIVIFVALASPAPSPSPAAPAANDPCGGSTTNLLATLNRPTIGFSACAVKPRQSLWELGYNNVLQSDGTRVAIYPQGFIRFGAAPQVELNIIGPNYQVQNAAGSVQRGFADSGIGAKYEFFQDESNVAAIDFLYSVPTGAPTFTAGAPIATLNLDYGRSLSPASGFGTTLGVQSSYAQDLSGHSARFMSLLPSVSFTTQTNARTQFYAEVYGQTRIRPDGGTLFGIDGGVQYLLTPTVEIDAELGQTVTDLSRAHYIGFGLGLRF